MKVTHNDIARWVKNPPAKQTDMTDDSGLIVRRNIDGSITFCARRRIGGKRMRKTFGRYPAVSLADARQAARAWLAGLVETPVDPLKRATWGDVVEAYLEMCRVKNKSWKQQEHIMRTYPPKSWWDIPAENLTVVRVQKVLMSMKGKYQSNRLLAHMKAALNYAVQLQLIKTNPIRDMKKLHKERSRKNILDFGQIRDLWAVCDEYEYPAAKVIQLLLLTGARRGEILNAKWSGVGDDRWLEVPTNKADRPHKIYLGDLAWDIVHSLESHKLSPNLFPNPKNTAPTKDIKVSKATIAKAADIGAWQLRDLRSTFLSHCVEHCGVLPVVAKVCANHELEGVTDQNYLVRTAYYPLCKEAWIRYGQLVAGIVHGEVGKVLSINDHGSSALDTSTLSGPWSPADVLGL